MKIIIDGDACPVKDVAFKIAEQYNVEIILVMSIKHYSSNNIDKTIYVDSFYQAADMAIVNRAVKGDIVVTNDYGLASLCLAKGCFCISFSGKHISNKNIDELLNIRFVSQKVRASGGKVKGPSKRTNEDDERFKNNLEKIVLSLYRGPQLEL
jgi:uncharacterized protein